MRKFVRPPRGINCAPLRESILAGALACLILVFNPGRAQAATITVTDPGDSGAGTLRQAIADANSGDTIYFSLPPGTTAITVTSAELLINKNLTISGPGANLLSVQRSTADGTPNFRIFEIASANLNVTISGLTIAYGNSTTQGGCILDQSTGTFTVTGCALSLNADAGAGDGGGIAAIAGTSKIVNSTFYANVPVSGIGGGGGIYNAAGSTMTITSSTMYRNGASKGGAIYNLGTLSIGNSTISGNDAFSSGGGILNSGTLNMRNCIVAGNNIDGGGDAPSDFSGTLTSQGYNLIGTTNGTTITGTTTGNQLNVNPQLGPFQDNGGPTQTFALLSGSTAIDAGNSGGTITDQRGLTRPVDSPVILNATGGDGSDIGAYEVQGDQLPGCGNTIVTNNNDSGSGSLRSIIANVCQGETITFASSVVGPINLTSGAVSVSWPITINGPGANLMTVQRSASAVSNFNIFNVFGNGITTISGLTIANGNPQGYGGGISFESNGSTTGNTLIITDCVIAGNAANAAGVLTTNGGGIYVGTIGAPILIIRRSTISGNSASQDGGGIFAGSLTVINSTISGNTAARFGGGLSASGTTTIVNSTIANNTGATGGGLRSGGVSVTARNTIFARNIATTTDPDFSGSLTSQDFNLIGNDTGTTISPAQFSDQIGTPASPIDPMLGPLQDNGGPTPTLALLSGSRAIDKGDSSFDPITSVPITTDQRGSVRPYDYSNISNATGGDGSDIGAFELQVALKIVSITRSANGHAILQCLGVPSQVNDLQVSPDLSAGSFAPISPAPAAADGTGAFLYDDAGAVGLTKRFYRLVYP